MKKACYKCGIEKPLSEFYPHKNNKDGHLGQCKECSVADATRWRIENKDRYNEYRRGLNKRPHRRAINVKKQRVYVARHPEKAAAHSAVSNALRRGLLVRPSQCARCGCAGIIHGHHADYNKPLDVIWLCHVCHTAEHKGDTA